MIFLSKILELGFREIQKRKAVFFVFCLLGWSCFAQAYVPPSQYILKTWISKHVSKKTLRIRSLVTAVDHDKPTEIHFKDTTWLNPETLTVKYLASDDQERKLFKGEKNGDSVSPAGTFLMSADVQRVVQVLKNLGIPIRTEEELGKFRTEAEKRKSEVESLARWNGGIAWLIGDQLWMEKDAFVPLRLTFTSGRDSQNYDFRFEGSRYSRDFQYPKISKLYRKGEWVLSAQVIDISVDNESPGARFNHKGSSDEPDYTEVGKSASSSLRNLIRLYYESFR